MTEGPDRPPLYPVSLDVRGQVCLVVGGGRVAARKARSLLECGAAVTVITPTLSSEMEELVPALRNLVRRSYATGDASPFRLVVTATGIPEVDGVVYADAEAAGVWANSADDMAHSSFILPAVHRDGPVTVSVSTGGLSPALASWLRTRLAADCGDGIGMLAQLLGEARAHMKETGRSTESVDWRQLLDGPLLDIVRAGDLERARTAIRDAIGV